MSYIMRSRTEIEKCVVGELLIDTARRGEHVSACVLSPLTSCGAGQRGFVCLRALVYVASVPRRVRTVSGTRSRARASSHCKCGTNITSESHSRELVLQLYM